MRTLLLLCVWSLVAGLHTLPWRARGGEAWKKHQQGQTERFFAQEPRWLDVPFDHFGANKTTFKIKYYVNETFWDGQGPSFLILGGEGPVHSAGGGFIGVLARNYNARIVHSEHRFYGESVPATPTQYMGGLLTPTLKYLTSRQALADNALLIRTLNGQTTGTNKWFVFGGSYPGALSAWFRIIYPDLSKGSLASSGVVNAILDFTEFDYQVATSAGAKCAALIRRTTSAFEKALANSDTKAKALALFGVRPDLSDTDFYYMIADSAAMSIQYNHKTEFCAALAQMDATDESAMVVFANWTNHQWGSSFGSMCFYDTECLKNEPKKWQPTSRSWRWQKCNELAYLQSAPTAGSLRSSALTLDALLQQCRNVFGDIIEPKTENVNALYGGALINATKAEKIFFSDFSDDPWQQASVMSKGEAGEKCVFHLATCEDCGHCYDFATPAPGDPQPLVDLRAHFDLHLGLWLEEE